jgi:hypothetical protein
MTDTGPTDKQIKLVRLLTSNCRVSLNRAWKLAGYSNHHPSLDQMLRSPAIVALFASAIEQGRILPHDHADRIMAAIARADLAALR